MIVLDTHVWLWLEGEPRRLSKRARRAIDAADAIGVSAMSVFEVAASSARGRIRLDPPVRRWVATALARERVVLLEVTADVGIEAGQLMFTGDPGDRIVYATARVHRAQLVTKDERIRAFDPALTVW